MDEELKDFVSLSQASSIFGLSADHLRRLVEKEKIWGIKIGRNWITSRQAVQEYVKKRHPRGPKQKNP
jgi:excisionase family DNA binding protein